VRENAIANQSGDPAEKNSRRHEKGEALRPAVGRFRLSGRIHEQNGAGVRIGMKQFITRVTREVVNPDSGRCALSLARREIETFPRR
jgi:hypothetical protein